MHAPKYPSAPRSTTFEEGVEFQDFVCIECASIGLILQNLGSKKHQLSRGENLQGFEIKLDRRCQETGQLSIEIAEKSKATNTVWVPSGIHRGDSWLYIQGNYQKFWVFATNWLRRYHGERRPSEHESYGTVRKFYLSLDDADRCAARVVIPRRAA